MPIGFPETLLGPLSYYEAYNSWATLIRFTFPASRQGQKDAHRPTIGGQQNSILCGEKLRDVGGSRLPHLWCVYPAPGRSFRHTRSISPFCTLLISSPFWSQWVFFSLLFTCSFPLAARSVISAHLATSSRTLPTLLFLPFTLSFLSPSTISLLSGRPLHPGMKHSTWHLGSKSRMSFWVGFFAVLTCFGHSLRQGPLVHQRFFVGSSTALAWTLLRQWGEQKWNNDSHGWHCVGVWKNLVGSCSFRGESRSRSTRGCRRSFCRTGWICTKAAQSCAIQVFVTDSPK